MKGLYTLLVLGTSVLSLQAQQIDGDFDKDWVADQEGNGVPTNYDSKRPGTEPFSWTASNVNQKVVASKKAVLVTPDADRTKETGHSVKMVNTYVGAMGIGSNAPAYITLGKPWVYAVYSISKCDGGTLGGKNFKYRPDAITGYYKTSGISEADPAKVIVYSWKGSYQSTVKTNPGGSTSSSSTATVTDQDRVIWNQTGYDSKSDDAELISKSELAITQNTSDWTEFTLPLNYLSENQPEKVNVVLSASNYWSRSAIAENGTLWVDDVKFVYYHALSAIRLDGEAIDGFSEDVLSYDLSSVVYDADRISFDKKGVGASVEKSYDAATGVLTITVKGNDYDADPTSVTTYTLQFGVRKVADYTNSLTVTLDGTTMQPQTPTFQVADEVDGTTTFQLRNFTLGEGEAAIHVGTITLKDVTVDGGKYTFNKSVAVEPGDDPDYKGEWMDKFLTNVPIVLNASKMGDRINGTIDIDMSEAGVGVIKVVLAPEVAVTPEKGFDLAATDSLMNASFIRTFKKGWNTVVAPFPMTAELLGAEEVADVYGFSAKYGVVVYSKVENGELKANTPYLVKFSADTEAAVFYGGVSADPATKGQLVSRGAISHDGDEDENVHRVFAFRGNYTPALSLEGHYTLTTDDEGTLGFAKGEGTLPATEGYFDFTNVTDPAAVIISFEKDDLTGISDAVIVKDNAHTAVYTLQGVKVAEGTTAGLPAGIYVVGGQKVIVK